VPAHVQVEEGLARLGVGGPAPGLPVHDADRADPYTVVGIVELPFDLSNRHVGHLLGQGEDLRIGTRPPEACASPASRRMRRRNRSAGG
jgi:hypothetical protein